MGKFSVGDEVVVRAWADMAEEFGLDSDGDIRTVPVFVGSMASFCGREAMIVALGGHRVQLKFEDKGTNIYAQRWSFGTDMIEHTLVYNIPEEGDLMKFIGIEERR